MNTSQTTTERYFMFVCLFILLGIPALWDYPLSDIRVMNKCDWEHYSTVIGL